ncbi:uncharacterized protein TRAVEDRAFT_48654 [Trametes versicolor FP-101664 SS1]|uniref:uncharacterized protein n=1 Tax=Trametes versicolor (strain FP-101664) TaxID=717944 RepID=UPI000462317B|nr:uncharacterized protein TRAVEDRAFT_48654 [Trametes versicolor FP-101664 SS1]EIW57622.1 hypothetical protein TRAVEDRAFT_48654 [Trametes versicolor FP-101664 SS1]
MSAAVPTIRATSERVAELTEALTEIRQRVAAASAKAAKPTGKPVLVAVSKYKPAGDLLACYDEDQRDFGENYVQELVDKAAQLPQDIRWHFIGTLQSNKAKILATIPNLYAIQTVTSIKAASALNKALPADRVAPLNILLQVNTSGEDAKSGVPPLSAAMPEAEVDAAELVQVARFVVAECPRLRLQGLMTIGALAESLAAGAKENEDFARLVGTRDVLQAALARAGFRPEEGRWGEDGRLLLSMGMSSDFEAALQAGSDIVRVGTGIFGSRPKKEEVKAQ